MDVNGDGYSDLVLAGQRGQPYVGEPYVAVVFGGETGLDPRHRAVLTRADLDLPEEELEGGAPAPLGVGATGDLDGDGCTDLLLGGTGGHIVWGGPEGPEGPAAPVGGALADSPSDADGPTTAVADFDGDGALDIAALELHLDADPDRLEGAYLRGPFARSGRPAAALDLPLPSAPAGDALSERVAAIDANGDAAVDLLREREGDESPVTHPVLASAEGTGPTAEELGTTPSGHGLATGDVDGDGAPDLLVAAHGVPNNENQLGEADPELHPGYVDVYSGAEGFARGEPARITRATPGVPGRAEDGDGFGHTLLVADVNGDGYDDAVVPMDTRGATRAIAVLPGGPEGIVRGRAADLRLPADDADRPDAWTVHALRDYTGDGTADLLLEIPHAGDGGHARFALYPGTAEGLFPRPLADFTTEGF
ncbi:VCBS repeat-containing protein [Streptomonospora sp. S1-112]|uniref:VCBS repeat-containing protein n=1 Tax=Streptomonospora mangrovi TaxID=2883123 RepID=A0A9X3SKW7_9ACTN|nr:VCBS repeat-containing protein [Streptomonospora mangrovi]MDA0563171.1 VCBS repeat-containing protein [Streptomonospora mangrovi]